MADDDQPRARTGRRKNGIDGFAYRPKWQRQLNNPYSFAGFPAGPFPDTVNSAIFVIGEQHIVSGFERERVSDDVHSDGGVIDKDQIATSSADKSCQSIARRPPSGIQLPDEKIHRLAIDRILPLLPRF